MSGGAGGKFHGIAGGQPTIRHGFSHSGVWALSRPGSILISAVLLTQDTFARLCRARELLRETNGTSSSVKRVAREVGISHYHFIRQFEALFGITPHQFRIRLRLEQAKGLLAAGGTSVTDVCMEVGMSSLGSFSGHFARRTGTTPSAYRSHARTLASEPGGCRKELFPGCLTLLASLPAPAFRNFREASASEATLEFGNANQAHQPDGG